MNYEKSLRTAWVFLQKPETDLKYTDLLVYSYLVNKAKFEQPTSQARAASATRLNAKTVAASYARLQERGFLSESGRPVAQTSAFFERDGDGHWANKMSFFPCYLPSSGDTPLSVVDCMVFSYVLFLVGRKKFRLSHQYIANAVGTDARTVGASLKHLHDLQLIQIVDGGLNAPSEMVGEQLGWFAGKGETAASKTIGKFTPDPSKIMADVSVLKSEPEKTDNKITACATPPHSDIMTPEAIEAKLRQRFARTNIMEEYYDSYIKEFIAKEEQVAPEEIGLHFDRMQTRIHDENGLKCRKPRRDDRSSISGVLSVPGATGSESA